MDQYKYECKWSPKGDITTYELAICIPFMFSKLLEMEMWDELSESIKRHFIVTKFNYGKMIENTAAEMKKLLDEDD